MTLDKNATVASYVHPPPNIDQPALKVEDQHVEVTEEWLCNHVQKSKYCFQVVACNNDNCCPNRPAHVKKLLRPLLPNGFLPPPVKYAHKFKGKQIPLAFSTKDLLSKTVKFSSLFVRSHYPTTAQTPFDFFCPSMQTKLQNCVYDICKRAFPSKAQMIVHRRAIHKFKRMGNLVLSELLELEKEQLRKNIEFIVDHNLSSKEFKVVFIDGTVDWVTILDQNNIHVQKYFLRKNIYLGIETFQAAEGSWLNLQWEETEEKEN